MAYTYQPHQNYTYPGVRPSYAAPKTNNGSALVIAVLGLALTALVYFIWAVNNGQPAAVAAPVAEVPASPVSTAQPVQIPARVQ